jgi:hypothetical protein
MAGRKKGTFANAQSALVKALRNMEKSIAGLVPSIGSGKSKSIKKRKSKSKKKRATKSRGR